MAMPRSVMIGHAGLSGGVNKRSLKLPALVQSIIGVCQMATCQLVTMITANPRYCFYLLTSCALTPHVTCLTVYLRCFLSPRLLSLLQPTVTPVFSCSGVASDSSTRRDCQGQNTTTNKSKRANNMKIMHAFNGLPMQRNLLLEWLVVKFLGPAPLGLGLLDMVCQGLQRFKLRSYLGTVAPEHLPLVEIPPL